MTTAIYSIVAYLLGALPFGLLVAKARGIDIRTQGSGNIGATNVFRCVGKGWGVFTFVFDALKGFIPAFFFPKLAGVAPEYGVLFGALAILGHSFSVYLKFKGGKGVATGAGMLLGVAPVAVGVGFLCWIICMVAARMVSLASIVASIAAAITVWVLTPSAIFINILLTLMAGLVIWLHRVNIKRIYNGTEHRFVRKKR